jgi:hypothetical protein
MARTRATEGRAPAARGRIAKGGEPGPAGTTSVAAAATTAVTTVAAADPARLSASASPRPAGPGGTSSADRWLFLIHQLPVEPAYLRVKVARRLRRLGAVQLKSSVYVLPAGEESGEDFRWLLGEIVAAGGEATVVEGRLVGGLSDREVVAMFCDERDREYEAIRDAAEACRSGGEARPEELERLRRRLAEVVARDPFEAPGRDRAEAALQALADHLRPPSVRTADGPTEGHRPLPRAATWVTRRHAKVDRLACSWLIRRFLDPQATLRFVDPAAYEHRPGELRFDMDQGEFGHRGDRCSFETLLADFGLDADPALRRVGEVVHDVDCKETRFGHPETPGLATLIDGLAKVHLGDEERVAAAETVFDALLASLRAAIPGRSEPGPSGRR